MQVNLFNGGLNKRLDPSLVNISEGLEVSNVDDTSGALVSAKAPLDDGREAKGFFYIFADTVYQSDNERDYVEYNRNLYWTEPAGTASKVVGGTTSRLGLDYPIPTLAVDGDGDPIFNANQSQILGLVVTFEDFVQSDFVTSINEIGGGLSAGTYSYRLFVYNGNKLIATFDHTETVGAASAVQFLLSTYNTFKLGKLDGGNYKLIATSNGVEIGDRGQALGATITDVITTDKMVSQWTYTYYNSSDGTESAPADLTDEYDWPLSKKVKLYNFTPSSDPQVDIIRLYRLSEGLTTPALVKEIPANTVSTYDYTQNTDLTRILDTYNNQPPLTGLQFLTEAYGVFFAALGSKLYFSQAGNANYWPALNFLEFGFQITGILPISGGMLIFSSSKGKILTGTSAADFTITPITSEQGCRSHKSCKLVKNFPVWVSNDGFCTWQNGAPLVLSKEKLGKISLLVRNTAVYDETYWVLRTDGSIIAMDLRFGLVFRQYFLGNILEDIGNFDDTLYSNIEDKLVKLFASDEDLQLYYLSPKFSDGSVSHLKKYNEVYLSYDGEFEVSVFLDDKPVVLNLPLIENIIKIPAELQQAYTISISIKGKGTFREYAYNVLGRQNGR